MVARDRKLGRRIERWLAVTGITKKELARRCHVKPPSLSDWLSGRTRPTGKNLDALAASFGVTLSEFFGVIPTTPSHNDEPTEAVG